MNECELDNVNYKLFRLVDDGNYIIGHVNGVMVVGQVKGETIPSMWVQTIDEQLVVIPVADVVSCPDDIPSESEVVRFKTPRGEDTGIVMGSTTPTLWVKDTDGQAYFIPVCNTVVISAQNYLQCVSHTALSWSELMALLNIPV